MLGWLVDQHGIEPHVTVFDKSARKDGTFSREDFRYDHERDVYFCPGGKTLTTSGTLVNDDATILYRATKHDCAGCALEFTCCPNSPARKVPRSIHEGARDMARAIANSWEGRTSRRLRKKIEMLFAHPRRLRPTGFAGCRRAHIGSVPANSSFPPIKGNQRCASNVCVRASRLATDETCQRAPRGVETAGR